MLNIVSSLLPLLLAAAILLAGNGLQGTLLAVRADLEGFPTVLIGVLMSAYFAGFIIGCRVNPRFIKSVGHIRTFVALASVASAATLIHPMAVHVGVWALLRAVTGFCFAGLVMVIESWINERAVNANRGRVLSVYRMTDLTATMTGNALLASADPAGFQLFALISILMSVALVPVALTRAPAPKPIETARLDVPRLFRVSPLAAIGVPLIGLGNAAFWAVGPVYAQKLGYDKGAIAVFMGSVIVGAALFQWPAGWASDKIDRRYVMIGSAALGVGAALALSRFGRESETALFGLGFLFGAFIIPMFGLAAAHANDQADAGNAVETTGGLLLLHGAGSVVGAAAGGAVMSIFGPGAVFLYIAAVYAVFIVICVIRMAARVGRPVRMKIPFVPMPKFAAPTIAQLRGTDRNPGQTESSRGAPSD